MHIAQGVMKALNVNKLTKSGVHFKFWVADWFAQLNNKMGGDLKKIQVVGKYLVEIWRALVCLATLGQEISLAWRGWMARSRHTLTEISPLTETRMRTATMRHVGYGYEQGGVLECV